MARKTQTNWLKMEDKLLRMAELYRETGNAIDSFRRAYGITDFKDRPAYYSLLVHRLIRRDKFKKVFGRVSATHGEDRTTIKSNINNNLDNLLSDSTIHPSVRIRAMALKAKINGIEETSEDAADNKITIEIKNFTPNDVKGNNTP